MAAWIVAQIVAAQAAIANTAKAIAAGASQAGQTIVQVTNDISGWVTTQISNAVSTLRQWTIELFATWKGLSDYVSNWWYQTEGWVNIQIHRAEESLYITIRDWAVGIFTTYEAVRDFIIDTVADAEALINISIHRLLESLYIVFRDWVGANFAKLDDLTGGDLGKLVKGLIPILDSLLLFFQDPVRALRDLLLPLFVDWICSALAHAINPSIPLLGARSGSASGGGPEDAFGVSPSLSGELAWPLDGFYICGNWFGHPAGHMGVDYALPAGRKVYAISDGSVRVPPFMEGGYGNYVEVAGPHWWSRYGHGAKVLVEDGSTVIKGQIIMIGNSTGNSTGDHLHLEVKYNGQWVDPSTLFP